MGTMCSSGAPAAGSAWPGEGLSLAGRLGSRQDEFLTTLSVDASPEFQGPQHPVVLEVLVQFPLPGKSL